MRKSIHDLVPGDVTQGFSNLSSEKWNPGALIISVTEDPNGAGMVFITLLDTKNTAPRVITVHWCKEWVMSFDNDARTITNEQ